MAGDKENSVIDLRGAKLLPSPNERRVFVPPSVWEVRKVRAANLMNRTPELAKAWHDAMNGLVAAMDGGLDVVEGLVPRGGAGVLSLLGFCTEHLGEQGEADRVRVSLTDPFVAQKVMS